MPIIIGIGVFTVVYGGIGLAVRAKFFPREPVQMALAWPIVFKLGGR